MSLLSRYAGVARQIVAGGTFRGGATALVITSTGALLNFAMFALCARLVDAATFGALAIAFNAMSFLSAVVLFGQETLIIRSWREYLQSGRPALARGALVFGLRIVVAVALVAAIATVVAWHWWDKTLPMSFIAAAAAFMFGQAIMQFSSLFTRAAAGVAVGDGVREIISRGLALGGIVAIPLFGLGLTLTSFFMVTAAAYAVAITIQAVLVSRFIPEAIWQADTQFDLQSWIPRSVKMWLAALLDRTAQHLEVVLVGVVLSPTAAGIYFVLTRISNAFALISGAVSVYATSLISTLYFGEDRGKLQHQLQNLAGLSAVLVGGCMLIVVVGGKLLLWAFGSDYVVNYPSLLILAAGASIAALAGPTTHLLLLTGHEGTYPWIMGGGLVLRFGLIGILGPIFGLSGVVIAVAVSAVIVAAAMVIASRRLVGLDPSMLGAILAVKRRGIVSLTESSR